MKQIALTLLAAVLMLTLNSCGASKKVAETSPVATFIQPGADLISGDGLIRGWGMGKSDNEASAHKKAMMNASATLAAALNQTVENTTEEYTAMLTEGNAAASKSLLYDSVKVAVKEVLNGATVIFDRWAEDPNNGQKTNYVVLELKGEDFLKQLYKKAEEYKIDVDEALLNKLFMKHIGTAAAAQ